MNKTGVPVLMYHGIVNDESEIVNPVHVSKKDFEKQMAWLSANNYRTITIAEMLGHFRKKEELPKCVVLTFDDGYESLFKNATPILERFGFTATLFLLTGAVGKTSYAEFNTKHSVFPENDRPLNWRELIFMENSCWDVQSHGRNHHNYNVIQYSVFEKEMRCSKQEIEQYLQKQVKYFCYPYGSYNTRCLELLKTAGYEAGFSVHPGMATWNSDTRRLPRIQINHNTELECFEKKVQTGYSGILDKLKSSVRYVFYKNTKVKDIIKKVYDRTK